MRIGITGVTGFVGSAVARVASQNGHQVTGFTRDPGKPIPHTVASRGFRKLTPDTFAELDAIIHLAGESIFGVWTPAKKQRIKDSRLEVTQKLVDCLGQIDPFRRPKVLVSGSAVGYYGDRGEEILDEAAPPGKGFLAELAREWEEISQGAQAHDVRVVNPRLGLVIGPGGGAAPIFKKIFSFGLGGKLGNGKQWVSWIGIEDLARMLVTAAEDESISGPVNAVSPTPVRNEDLTRALGKVLHRPTLFPVPSLAAKLLLGQMSELLLDSQRVLPVAWQKRGFVWTAPDLERLLDETFRHGHRAA